MKPVSVIILISSLSLLNLNSKSTVFENKIMKVAKVLQINDPSELNDYDVKFYFIDLEVSDTSTYIHGSTSILIELLNSASQYVILDMAGTLHVDSVLWNNRKASYLHNNDQLRIIRVFDVSDGGMINIQVFYNGTGNNRRNFAGLNNSKDMRWNKMVTWTLSEPYSAKNWFPCKQDLNDKADSAYVFLTTDNNLLAGSNGLLTAQVTLPGNKIRHEWKTYYPIAYYLISFAVSEYRDYSLYAKSCLYDNSILIQNYIYDNDVFFAENKPQIDTTVKLMELFTELFGPYPFGREKYGHCIVPSGGGMEHQTMTTLDHFSFEMIAHELAHQWFGNYVTCGTWQDIWINEGFASYAEYLAYQYLISQDEADRWMRNAHHIIQYSKYGSIYVPSHEMINENRIFDIRLSYQKGAAMIHMIRHEINDDKLFFGILKDFLSAHQNSTAVGLDFKNLLEYKTGKDFTEFYNQWYFGEGYPIHTINWQHHNDTLYISSIQSSSSSTSPFNILMDFKVTANGKDTLITVRQNANYENWHMYVPGKVTSIQADPGHWLLFDLQGINRQDHDTSKRDIIVIPNPSK